LDPAAQRVIGVVAKGCESSVIVDALKACVGVLETEALLGRVRLLIGHRPNLRGEILTAINVEDLRAGNARAFPEIFT
jgi:hypothetical protein